MSNQCYYCCCCSVACVLYSLSSFFFISYSAPLTARAWKQFRSVVSSHLKPNSMYQAAIAAAHCCWYSMMNIMNYSVDFTHIIFFVSCISSIVLASTSSYPYMQALCNCVRISHGSMKMLCQTTEEFIFSFVLSSVLSLRTSEHVHSHAHIYTCIQRSSR